MKNIKLSFKIQDGSMKAPYTFIVKAKSAEEAMKNFMKVFEEQLDYADSNGYAVLLEATEQ